MGGWEGWKVEGGTEEREMRRKLRRSRGNVLQPVLFFIFFCNLGGIDDSREMTFNEI